MELRGWEIVRWRFWALKTCGAQAQGFRALGRNKFSKIFGRLSYPRTRTSSFRMRSYLTHEPYTHYNCYSLLSLYSLNKPYTRIPI